MHTSFPRHWALHVLESSTSAWRLVCHTCGTVSNQRHNIFFLVNLYAFYATRFSNLVSYFAMELKDMCSCDVKSLSEASFYAIEKRRSLFRRLRYVIELIG